jgi:conjugal transfer pilus assembly protein TraW
MSPLKHQHKISTKEKVPTQNPAALLLLLILAGVLWNNSALAVDFGKRGASFAIKEEGFLEMMKRKLEKIDLEQENKKMQAIAKERVNNPRSVDGIKAASENREFYWDPTYTLKKDVLLPCGKVLQPAGTKVNPLDEMDFDRILLFIDAREMDQVKWLEAELANYNVEDTNDDSAFEQNGKMEARVILVGGSPLQLQEQLGIKAYFDQFGELTSKFGIKAVPAIAEQDGKMIKIREVLIDGGARK